MNTKITTHKNYFDLPVTQLLEEYGAGSHIPGSGSAAALSALLAAQLMRTVATLTLSKEAYESVYPEIDFILSLVTDKYIPALTDLFHSDIREFAEVSRLRRLRDLSTGKEKERLGREAAEQLKKATQIPLQICDLSIELLKYATALYDSGYKATRGDSGVAISNLLSAASGALFVIFLNIKVAKKSKWVSELRIEATRLAGIFTGLQKDAFQRVVNLYTEGLPDDAPKLPFPHSL